MPPTLGHRPLLDRWPLRVSPSGALHQHVGDGLLQVDGMTKSFGGVKALDNLSARLYAGEVHALHRENGAGTSTLIKIIARVLPADAGTVGTPPARARLMWPWCTRSYRSFRRSPCARTWRSASAGHAARRSGAGDSRLGYGRHSPPQGCGTWIPRLRRRRPAGSNRPPRRRQRAWRATVLTGRDASVPLGGAPRLEPGRPTGCRR